MPESTPNRSIPLVHGHRGCNAGVPPNTIPAFLKATAMGCHWLEMDVVITGDDHVLVSHEPWMDHATCLDPQGLALTEAQGRALNLYRMPLAEIQQYRSMCAAPAGPAAPKPTLAEVVGAVRRFAHDAGLPEPGFNIEIKSAPPHYGAFQPPADQLARRVLQEVHALGIGQQCLVQCFDPAVLAVLHQQAPALPTAFLLEQPFTVQLGLRVLGFRPAFFSPSFRLIDQAMANELRENGIGLLAWTVNDGRDMERMIRLGVQGLITDKPAEALALLALLQ